MVRKLLVFIFGTVLVAGLLAVGAPAQAGKVKNPYKGLEVYSEGPFDDQYEFTDEECGEGLTFDVKGRAKGYETLYVAPDSGGQAFLQDIRYRFREVWRNPDTGKKAYVSGRARSSEIKATHVEGNVFEFIQVIKGKPFVVKNSRHKTVLAEWGKLVLRTTFDTLGDSQPGGEFLDEEVLKAKGNWPTWDEDFDWCGFVERVLG